MSVRNLLRMVYLKAAMLLLLRIGLYVKLNRIAYYYAIAAISFKIRAPVEEVS